MRKLEYTGDVGAIFAVLDHDRSGELSLEEIDAMRAVLWRRFRHWAREIFEGPEDFIAKIARAAGNNTVPVGQQLQKRTVSGACASVDLDTFIKGIRDLGWQEGY